jgi:hypothetical protein
VEAIGQITGVIAHVNEIANLIANSVEEQTATTNEISHNVAGSRRRLGDCEEHRRRRNCGGGHSQGCRRKSVCRPGALDDGGRTKTAHRPVPDRRKNPARSLKLRPHALKDGTQKRGTPQVRQFEKAGGPWGTGRKIRHQKHSFASSANHWGKAIRSFLIQATLMLQRARQSLGYPPSASLWTISSKSF